MTLLLKIWNAIKLTFILTSIVGFIFLLFRFEILAVEADENEAVLKIQYGLIWNKSRDITKKVSREIVTQDGVILGD